MNKPNSYDAFNFINKFYKSNPNKSILILIGNCMVNYNGRARSILDWGERIIMIKQDGNVLVHCRMGMSRSATLVIAYLMKKYNLSYEDAKCYV